MCGNISYSQVVKVTLKKNGSLEEPERVFLIGGVDMVKVSNDASMMYLISVDGMEPRTITEYQAHKILNRLAASLLRSENIAAIMRDSKLYQMEIGIK